MSAVQPCVVSYLSEMHCKKNKSKYLSTITIFIAISALSNAGLSLAYTSWNFELLLFNGVFVYKPWRLFIFTNSFISLVCFCLAAYLPESPKFLLSIGRKDESLAVLTRIHQINSKKGAAVFSLFVSYVVLTQMVLYCFRHMKWQTWH